LSTVLFWSWPFIYRQSDFFQPRRLTFGKCLAAISSDSSVALQDILHASHLCSCRKGLFS